MADHRWLLLGHQLLTRSSNARVKTWRRLQQVGAVPARNSVYVLPNTEQCREDFEWIRSEIVALGGEATVFAADAISNGGTDEIVSSFRRTREQEYRALKAEIDHLMPTNKSKRSRRSVRGGQSGRTLRALRERFSAIERVDFFDAPAREETAASLTTLEQALIGRPNLSASSASSSLSPAGFHGRRWVTRHRPGVDRMASAWLIRRFIDPSATFAFVDVPGGADVPFDMYTGEFSHQGDLCTFEVLAERFRLSTVAIQQVARIVHDLDMKDTKYEPPEASAVGRMVEGLRALHPDDGTLLAQGIAMFDALARSFESDEGALGSPRPSKQARRKAPRARASRRKS